MMLLFHIIWSALVSTQLVQLALLDEVTSEFVCLDQVCYSVSWGSQRYYKAKKSCKVKKGQLLTVKNTVQADAIAMFMAKAHQEDVKVWIGLEQPFSNRCTDLQLPLRGYTWVTGDNHTDYTNWKKEEQKCGAHCVTVRKDGTWEEIPCDSKADGYLCEISYSSPCFSLELPFSYNVTYYHFALGLASTGGTVFPNDTIVDISTSPNNTKLFCKEKADGTVAWSSDSPGAWSCLILKGGCEHECVEESDTAQCKCPSGSELKADHRGCTKPCDPNPCSQLCVPVSDPPGFLCMCSEGFTLGDDGRTCEDIDDCAANPNTCEHHCTNTIGGFDCGCKPGFEMVETCEPGESCGSLCLDIDECGIPTTLCEHGCENFDGGYRCYCDDGYVTDEKKPYKCKRFCNTSFCEADCDINNNDSCQCPEGYIVDQLEDGVYICADVDECDASPCDWPNSCINTFGSFLCTCPDGYTVHNEACIPPEEGSGGAELTPVPPSQTSPPTTRPPDIHSLQPAMLLGICIGIISMLTVLLAILCHMLRKHYIEEHALDYKCKNAEKDMVLQQVMTEPQHKL
ncbi:thrombomodulin-like [Bufo bufo]|uniref:thrombomodulin-like n=1 Tax=Bufo bufo TaxID=8384 RepID=UPI001ABDF585|nr:thrombomodulin-like [Bufo bufo]